MQVIHGALRMGSRRENRPFVLSQDLQPRGDVGRAVSFRSGGVIVSLSEGHCAVASFPLGMKPGLGFQGLPYVRIDGAFGHIAVSVRLKVFWYNTSLYTTFSRPPSMMRHPMIRFLM